MRLTVTIAIAAIACVSSANASAQSWHPPADSQRCPAKWGAGDERGAANHMKPETVLRAARLIRTGQVFELGRPLAASMPLQATRTFELHTKRTTELQGSNRRGSNEELVLAEIGQVGTQFDGFAHQTIGGSLYNCFQVDEVATRNGFTKLGIENIGLFYVLAGLTSIIARPVLGKKSDAMGRGPAIGLGLGAQGIGFLFITLASGLPLILAGGVFVALGSSMIGSTTTALAMDLANTRFRGQAMATFSVSFQIGAGVGAIIAGALADLAGLRGMYVGSIAITLAGFGLLALAWKSLPRPA